MLGVTCVLEPKGIISNYLFRDDDENPFKWRTELKYMDSHSWLVGIAAVTALPAVTQLYVYTAMHDLIFNIAYVFPWIC
jgi:hypothetical protein